MKLFHFTVSKSPLEASYSSLESRVWHIGALVLKPGQATLAGAGSVSASLSHEATLGAYDSIATRDEL